MEELTFELDGITDIYAYQEYERQRQENEQQRQNSENIRNENENQRESNEQQRENYYQEIQQKVNNGEFNGRGIVNTEKISSSGLIDTYRINYTDGKNPDTFTVANGGGDMLKSMYDINQNGIVDNSEALNGHNSDYFASKQYSDDTFATKAEATYTTENTSTVNMNLSSNKLSATLNDNSVSEQKLEATLASKINGKLDSANALSFSTEEEMEEDTNETSTTTTTTNNETE